MWPDCLKHRVAALTYYPLQRTDLRKHPHNQPEALWAELAPAQKANLRRVAYQMKRGDTIYVKEGKHIIGKGIVLGPYKYDRRDRIIDPKGYPWNHQVPVKWQTDFTPIPVLLGAEQFTVMPLTRQQVRTLERQITRTRAETRKLEVTEGQRLKAESVFRKRNRTIIAAKKALSDGTCEACGMRFSETYRISDFCLVAHHRKSIGQRKRASKTKVDDIALVCPNCHAVAHTQEPPLPVAAIKRLLK